LEGYRRAFRRRLGLHHMQITDYSTGRRIRLNERMMFRAAATDPVVAAAVEEFVTRRKMGGRLLDPRIIARTLRPIPSH
jgi:hypothetical protein